MDLWLGIAVVIATVMGPILAVLVTRSGDKRREIRQRQLDVFRVLMRSRKANLSPDYVTSLNLVEVEFHNVPKVLRAHRELYKHLGMSAPPGPDWQEQRARLQTRLLVTMARSLGYDMEDLDVLEGGYFPQGWNTVEEEQQQMRRLLIDLLTARRSLPVTAAAPSLQSDFLRPPPPPPDDRG